MRAIRLPKPYPRSLAVLLAVLLFVAMGNWPASYYVLLRVVVALSAAILCVMANEEGQEAYFWIFLGIAFLFNPFIPLRLSRESWLTLDVLGGFLSFFFVFQTLDSDADKKEID
jgi:hypothetical protein